MIPATIPDEILMALADGELPEPELEAARAKLAADPAAAARFAVFVETRMLVRNSERRENEAVSERLVAAVRAQGASLTAGPEQEPSDRKDRPRLSVLAGGADSAPTGRHVRRRQRPSWLLPVAAVVLLALGGLAGYFAAPRGGDHTQAAILAVPVAETALTRALNTAASGTDVSWSDPSGRSGRITVLSTHRLDDGTLCREFDVSREDIAVTGASCRRSGAWRTEVAALKPTREGAYAPARGGNLLDDYLRRLGSEGVLSPEEEKAAMARGWAAR